MFPQREANDSPRSFGLWGIRVDSLCEDLLTKTIMRGNDYAIVSLNIRVFRMCVDQCACIQQSLAQCQKL